MIMKEELKKVMNDELCSLEKLYNMLLKQQQLLIKKDAFGLDKIAIELNVVIKEIAASEMNRIKLVNDKTMLQVLKDLNDNSINELYNTIRKAIDKIKIQKDSNEILIKQGIIFTTKVLNAINPNRTVKTYNCYGKTK